MKWDLLKWINGDRSSSKHGVAPVHARVRANKDVKGFSLFYIRWFSPRAVPLWRCRSESIFYAYFIQTYMMYLKNKPTHLSRERLIIVSIVHLSSLENCITKTTAFLRRELALEAKPAFKWVQNIWFRMLVLMFIHSLTASNNILLEQSVFNSRICAITKCYHHANTIVREFQCRGMLCYLYGAPNYSRRHFHGTLLLIL